MEVHKLILVYEIKTIYSTVVVIKKNVRINV